ncbi:MAG: aminotransferase class I/II-fold pyridoxal phosphate-dependent enzyme [Spirochaetia bacterium]|nr:aminotransferase class I/II-fold pyridoxal phosphate-dependent enzyme [Spirochaetia bacterium]
MSATRVANSETTIFTVVNSLAAQHNAVGLSQGAPDFDTPRWVLDIIKESFDAGRNQYAPLSGVPEFRQAISGMYKAKYGLNFDPATQITVTSGATEAIFDSVMALCDPGDELIAFEPFFDSYAGSCKMALCTMKAVTLHLPDFSFDRKELEDAITPRTKAIIINNPNNPSGKVFSREELTVLSEIANKYNLVIISDEVYENLVFDGLKHIPTASIQGLADRTITINSTAKTFSATGWKIGYICTTQALTQAVQAVHQWVTFAVNHPIQLAFSRILPISADYSKAFCAEMEKRRDYLLARAAEWGFDPIKPEGSYFFMATFDKLSQKSDMEFMEELIKTKQVALIPASPFYLSAIDEGCRLMRFNFVKSMAALEQADKNMRRL